MLAYAFVTIGLIGMIGASVMAQGGPPPADAEPGSPGISFVVLSELQPAAAGGLVMDMRRYTWEPGSYVTPHTHPAAAFIVCVEVGSVGFSIQSGAAVVTRPGDGDDMNMVAEPMAPGDEVVLEPGECVAADELADSTIHTVWNVSDEVSTTIETYLYDREQPGRIFVDEHGTPVP
jgi:hypothetical protein